MPNANVIHKAHASGAWYTPEHVRAVARDVLGVIDLDPCTHTSNPLDAAIHYSIRNSAWRHDWAAELRAHLEARERGTASLWMNPPFGRGIDRWLDQWHGTIEALTADRFIVRALLLVPARTETKWYRAASWEHAQATCEIDHRLRFERRKGGRFVAGQTARWGCALLYYGANRKSAAAKLRALGNVRMGRKYEPPRAAEDPRQIGLPFEPAQGRLALVKP